MVIGIDASRANTRERTGTEQYSLNIITRIVSIDRTIRFVLYVDGPPIEELSDLGSNVIVRVLHWPLQYLWSQVRLSLEMLVHRPDVLFVPAHTIPLIHPRRTVTTIHDLGFEHNEDFYGKRMIGGTGFIGRFLSVLVRIVTLGRYSNSELDYHRWSLRYAVRHASRLLTISRFSQTEIASRFNLTQESITVIYHGFDTLQYRRSDNGVIERTLSSFSIQHPYIVYIGRLERKKNILALVQAFSDARTLVPNLSLVLIGKIGLGWDDAASFIRSHALSDSIHVLGWQPNAVAIPLLSGASALVFLSEYEGFGIPIIEAFATETPVIASNRTAIPEIAGDAALLVDPHDIRGVARRINDVLNDTALRSRLIASGKKRAAAFSWDSAARLTFDVLMQSP